MKEKMEQLQDMLSDRLGAYGFEKKKKGVFRRILASCRQEIRIIETKIRGQDRIHIFIHLGFSFEKINKLIMYLKNDDYYKGWGTGGTNINSLSESLRTFGFYIEPGTDLSPIAERIATVVGDYAMAYFECCSTYEKLEHELYSGTPVFTNNLIFKKEWNLLALAFILGNHSPDEVIEKYHEKFMSEGKVFEEAVERMKDREKIMEVIR